MRPVLNGNNPPARSRAVAITKPQTGKNSCRRAAKVVDVDHETIEDWILQGALNN